MTAPESGDVTGLEGLVSAVGAWRSLGDRYAAQLRQGPGAGDRARRVALQLELGDLRGALEAVFAWLQLERAQRPRRGRPDELLDLELLKALADVVERTGDQSLLDLFGQWLVELAPDWQEPAGTWPLVGVPVLNRPDLLERLIASFDAPVATLAIVDNSGGRTDDDARLLRALLERLERTPPHGIGRVTVARPFGNAGVAASWNQILLGFPEASRALIVGNDVELAPGVMAQVLARLDPERAQFLPLLPDGDAFSAFALTARAWDGVGLFEEGFHPAYCEDLDYRDRLRTTVNVEQLEAAALQSLMAERNLSRSATISSAPDLERQNRRSFQLNRLWYLDRNRRRGQPAGQWRRRWLRAWG